MEASQRFVAEEHDVREGEVIVEREVLRPGDEVLGDQ
jgi:hypothetical protein